MALQFTVDLEVKPAFGLGVLGEQVPRPGERVGDSLVSGEKDRDDLVAQDFSDSAVRSGAAASIMSSKLPLSDFR